MTRTWFSSATKSSRYSGSKTPCRRSSPSTKRFIKNPDSMRQDSNSTDVFTQPGPTGDVRHDVATVGYHRTSGHLVSTRLRRPDEDQRGFLGDAAARRGRAEFGTAAHDKGCGRSSIPDLSRQFCSEKIDFLYRGRSRQQLIGLGGKRRGDGAAEMGLPARFVGESVKDAECA